MKTKGRISGLLCMILTVAYAIYVFAYFNSVSSQNLSGALATAIVMPHLVCVVVAAIFALLGFFGKKRWAMLTCGVLLVVAAVVFMSYAPFVVIQAILAFVAYARMGVQVE